MSRVKFDFQCCPLFTRGYARECFFFRVYFCNVFFFLHLTEEKSEKAFLKKKKNCETHFAFRWLASYLIFVQKRAAAAVTATAMRSAMTTTTEQQIVIMAVIFFLLVWSRCGYGIFRVLSLPLLFILTYRIGFLAGFEFVKKRIAGRCETSCRLCASLTFSNKVFCAWRY